MFPENSAAIARLITAVVHQRSNTIALELAGPNAAATLPDDPWAEEGFNFLERQTSGIGGGTTEMARNNICERVLGMPREHTARQEHAVPRRARRVRPATELRNGRTTRRGGAGEPAPPRRVGACAVSWRAPRSWSSPARRCAVYLAMTSGSPTSLPMIGLPLFTRTNFPSFTVHEVDAARRAADLPEVRRG